MKRTFVLLGLLLLALASPALAEYGQWTQPWIVAGNYNNVLLDVAAVTPDNLFAVGIWTNNIDRFKFVWRSNDGGAYLEEIYTFTMSSDPGEMCDMLHITDARTAVAMTTTQFGLFGGSGVSQECIDKYGPDPGQQMICLIACAMTIGPSIWYTEDDGSTFEEAEIPYVAEASVQSISMLGENNGYAGGLGSYIIKTTDGGKTWQKTTALDSNDYYINTINFVNKDTGWLAIGEWDPDSGKEGLEGEALVKNHVHQMMLSSNAVYRHEFFRDNPAKGEKMLNGKIIRTTDGGETWEVQKSDAAMGFSGIYFTDENNGWVVGEEYTTQGDYTYLFRTTDGGENWEDVTATLPATIPGATGGWYPVGVKFVNPGFGMVFGVGAKVVQYVPVILYTEDGGDTWTADESITALSGGQMGFTWVNNRYAFSVGLYENLMRYEGSNAAPIADAGDDFATPAGVAAQLDGTGSSDPDGDGLFYTWTKVSGPKVEWENQDTATPTFTPSKPGTAVFSLTASDGELSSDADTVTVTITAGAADDDAADDDAADDDAADDDDNNAGDDDDDDDSGACGC